MANGKINKNVVGAIDIGADGLMEAAMREAAERLGPGSLKDRLDAAIQDLERYNETSLEARIKEATRAFARDLYTPDLVAEAIEVYGLTRAEAEAAATLVFARTHFLFSQITAKQLADAAKAGPVFDVECFLEGTQIDMWDGTQKPIEEITPDDFVVSYDKQGNLVSGKVTRIFQNRAKHILDVHGLMMTPGHVTYCAKVEGEENPFTDRHVPIMDILRSDGALMKKDGSLVRASTGAPVGSLEDKKIWAVAGAKTDGSITVSDKGQIRLGTRFIMSDGVILSVLDMIAGMGAMLNQDGFLVRQPTDKTGFVFHWEHMSMLPKPEDYVLQRSQVTMEDIYQADDWNDMRPHMPAPVMGEAGRSFKQGATLYAGASDNLPPNIPLSMRNSPNQPTMSRKQRRAMEAKQRKAKKRTAVSVH